jgi:hypothetical protein
MKSICKMAEQKAYANWQNIKIRRKIAMPNIRTLSNTRYSIINNKM